MAYTYDDFLKKATESGLYDSFDQDDLGIAQQHPEYGMSMLGLRQDYNGASTEEQRALVDAAMGQLRTSYGKAATPIQTPTTTPAQAQTPVQQGAYSGNPGTAMQLFSTQPAATPPVAATPGVYQFGQNAFSYDSSKDDLFSQYRKQYLREGERATANTLGQTAAATAGMPSSYAVNAAHQAGDYYNTQLMDKMPELENQAYQRWYNGQQQAQQQMQDAYNSVYGLITNFGIMPSDEELAAAGLSKEQAEQMRKAWEAQNPDLAWGMGQIDANRYHQITGGWPAGYSTGGGGYGGGPKPTPDYSHDSGKLTSVERQILTAVANTAKTQGVAAAEKQLQKAATGGNLTPNGYNAGMYNLNKK